MIKQQIKRVVTILLEHTKHSNMLPQSTLFSTDTRGVSSPLAYAFVLAITGVLVVGLVTGAGTLVQNEVESGSFNQMEVTGNLIGAQIASAEKVTSDSTERFVLETNAPDRITGTQYLVEINEIDDTTIEVVVIHPRTEQVVEYPIRVSNSDNIDTDVRVRGGDIVVVKDGDNITLENR